MKDILKQISEILALKIEKLSQDLEVNANKWHWYQLGFEDGKNSAANKQEIKSHLKKEL